MAIRDIIRLMDEHPLEWEFTLQRNYDNKQYLKHPKTGIIISVSNNIYDDVFRVKNSLGNS